MRCTARRSPCCGVDGGGRKSPARVWAPPNGKSGSGERGWGRGWAQLPSVHLREGEAPFRGALGEQGTSSGGWGWRGGGRGGCRRPHRQQEDPSVLNHIRQRWLTMGRCKVACGRLHRQQRSPGLWGLGRPSYEPCTLQRAVEKVRTAEALAALPHLHLAMTAHGNRVA